MIGKENKDIFYKGIMLIAVHGFVNFFGTVVYIISFKWKFRAKLPIS